MAVLTLRRRAGTNNGGFTMALTRSVARVLTGAACALMASVALVAPAAAEPYAPQVGNATVSATVVAAGQTVEVGGSNFCPGTEVSIVVTDAKGKIQDRATATADADGDVQADVSVQSPGRMTVTITGTAKSDCTTSRVLGTKFSVRSRNAAGAPGPGTGNNQAGGLANTGGSGLTPLWLGTGLLVAGGLLVGLARTRRAHG